MATGEILVRRVFDEVVNQKQIDLLDELFAGDMVDHGPMGDVAGRDAVKGMFSAWLAAVPDAHTEVSNVIEQGDTVAWVVKASGTHKGDELGFPGTGKRFETLSANLARVENGKVVEHWSEQGMFPMLVQLGVIAAP